MKFATNRFALLPFQCEICRRYVWLENYRKDLGVTRSFLPSTYTQRICNDCLRRNER